MKKKRLMIYLLSWKQRLASLSSSKLSGLSLMHVEESVIQDNSLGKKHADMEKYCKSMRAERHINTFTCLYDESS